jgi:hypothetical protein
VGGAELARLPDAAAVVMVCFFAGRAGWGACFGPLIRAHLIPKQRIKREWDSACAARSRGVALTPVQEALTARELGEIVWDARCWVPCCGGMTGIAGHHGMLDAWKLRIPRVELPPAVEEFAAQYGLGWSLERDYGKETG